MITGLEYPILYATDMEASRTFYAMGLGFQLESETEDFVELRLGTSRLALNRAGPPDKIAGHQTLLFASNDIEEDQRRLRAIANSTSDILTTNYGRTFIVRDPDGNKIEVVQ